MENKGIRERMKILESMLVELEVDYDDIPNADKDILIIKSILNDLETHLLPINTPLNTLFITSFRISIAFNENYKAKIEYLRSMLITQISCASDYECYEEISFDEICDYYYTYNILELYDEVDIPASFKMAIQWYKDNFQKGGENG